MLGSIPTILRKAADEWPNDQFVLDYIAELNAPGKVVHPEQVVTYLDRLNEELKTTPSSLARVQLLKLIGAEEAKQKGGGPNPNTMLTAGGSCATATA